MPDLKQVAVGPLQVIFSEGIGKLEQLKNASNSFVIHIAQTRPAAQAIASRCLDASLLLPPAGPASPKSRPSSLRPRWPVARSDEAPKVWTRSPDATPRA